MSDVEGMDAAQEERLEEIWEKDKLGRRADADFLIRFLTRRIEERGERDEKKSFVLNIDSQWGGGKTFFLTRFGKQLKTGNYLVADVNAWEDDHAEDPLIAVMAAIGIAVEEHIKKDEQLVNDLSVLNNKVGKVAIAVGAKILRHQADKYLGEGAADLIATGLNAAMETESVFENVIKNFQKERQEIHDFRTELEKFLGKLKDVKKPLFILVDEMDRCRPPYAIALLERVKHLFNIDNVIFVFATDTAQLSHSIKAVYGEGYDGHRYLHRFFDQTFRFPVPSIKDFVSSLVAMSGIPSARLKLPDGRGVENFCTQFFQDLNLPLRDISQCVDILHSVVTAWDSRYPPIHAIVILPLIVAFQNGLDVQLNGELSNKVLDMLTEKTSLQMNWEIEYFDQLQRVAGTIGWWEYFDAHIDMGRKSEMELSEYLGDDTLPIWKSKCGRYLLQEYLVVGSGGHNTLSCHPSMNQYFNVISSAGRLGSV